MKLIKDSTFTFSILLIGHTSFFSLPTYGREAEQADCQQKPKLIFLRQDIFDTKDPDTIFLHKWANALHIKTREVTLKNEAAFFLQKCQPSDEDLAELERHLRQRKYIRQASVSRQEDNSIIAQTWDNWSLTPTLSFGRKGGKNKFSIGIKDRNLLGLGIDSELRYFTNAQRKGYKVKTQFPLFTANNTNAAIVFTNSNDGRSQSFRLNKPFVSTATDYGYDMYFANEKLTQSLFHNGKTINKYNYHRQQLNLEWGWLAKQQQDSVLRWFTGLAKNKTNFTTSSETTLPNLIPGDFDITHIYFGTEFLRKDYKKLTNVHLINEVEDFNLGWQLRAQIGYAPSCNTGQCLLSKVQVSKGYTPTPESLLLFQFEANATFGEENPLNNTGKLTSVNRTLASFSAEYLYSLDQHWRFYLRNSSQISHNARLHFQPSIGGQSGVRGFPIDYQRGKHSTSFNTELRYYPNLNIYKMMEIGAAAFFDVGKTFGRSPLQNTEDTWIKSVGIGARLISSHSSDHKVGHIDLAFPISNNPNVNNIEFRITTKHTF